jgi:hypothetical protein
MPPIMNSHGKAIAIQFGILNDGLLGGVVLISAEDVVYTLEVLLPSRQ